MGNYEGLERDRLKTTQDRQRALQEDDAPIVSVVVCVDDTDDETRSTSTGKVAGLIAAAAEELGGQIRLGTTRHQLLLRDDIPYTSHNSSMAFEAQLPASAVGRLRNEAIAILSRECVLSADPGLAIAVVPNHVDGDAEAARQLEELISFGYRAKREFCPKQSAYEQADRIPWVTLSEHGGDGQGVVGALAGVGLRLSGSDGRFRGKHDLSRLLNGDDGIGIKRAPGSGGGRGTGGGTGRGNGRGGGAGAAQDVMPSRMPASVIAEKLSRLRFGPVRIVDVHGAALPADTPVVLASQTKAVYLGGSFTIVCAVENGVATPLEKSMLSDDPVDDHCSAICNSFEWDNDAEECAGRVESCRNCLHRRWESWGFSCMNGKDPRS